MPSSFRSSLVVDKIGNRLWKVYRELQYDIGDLSSGNSIIVPRGFITDFASVPRAFWIVLPPDGKYTAAAVVHDFLYHIQDRSRKECDLIFLEAMEVLEVSWIKRKSMYRAVRLFGWMPWNNHAKKMTISVQSNQD